MDFFLRKLYKLYNPIRKRLLFILGVIGWVILLCFLTPLLFILLAMILEHFLVGWQFNKTIQISDFVLFITAGFIVAYTYETKKLREESVFQKQMDAAVDVRFDMSGNYRVLHPDKKTFGGLTAAESLHTISRFTFLTAFWMRPIGGCDVFEKNKPNDKSLRANYFIKNDKSRVSFLRTLLIQEGKIKAAVLTTDGTRFIYTFQATGEGWKFTLKGSPNLNDRFVLVRKELDEL